MTLPITTITGSLGSDPELRFTGGGIAVVSLSIAVNDRKKNPTTQEWEDGGTQWYRATCWREFAEHVAGSLTKGMRVIAQGRLVQRSYQDREGNQRTAIELEIDEIGPSLRYATAQVTRAASNGGGQQNQPAPQQQATNTDAWNTGGDSYGDSPF